MSLKLRSNWPFKPSEDKFSYKIIEWEPKYIIIHVNFSEPSAISRWD